MQLVLRLEAHGSSPRDLVLEVDPTDTVGRVADALAQCVGEPTGQTLQETGGAALPRDRGAGQAGLRNGAAYRLVEDVAGEGAVDTRAVLAVVAGPALGARWPLDQGTVVLGRSKRNADIVLEDNQVSRRHASLSVAGSDVVVTDLGSLNGTKVGGQVITGPQALEAGTEFQVGDSVMVLQATTTAARTEDGRVLHTRPPRMRSKGAASTVRLPEPPAPPGKQKLPLTASLLPLVLGLGMLAAGGQAISLLFLLMSPVMAAGSAIEARRSGRGTHKEALATWRLKVTELSEQIASSRVATVEHRRRSVPAAEVLARRTFEVAPELWERTSEDEDFLLLAVGDADLPSLITVEAPSGAGELYDELTALAATATTDESVPLTVALQDLPHLGLCGPAGPTDDIARALIMQACTLHSPRDLAVIALLGERRAADYNWMRWLPHSEVLVSGAGARSIATTPEAVKVLFATLQELVAGRRSSTFTGLGTRRHSPHVLVLLDGSAPIDRSELETLLTDTPDQGVSVICVTGRRPEVPSQCKAIVDTTDAVTLTYTHTGDSYVTTQARALPAGQAEDLARALAGVRDAGAAQKAGALPSVVSLLDILQLPDPSADAVRAAWAQHPPGLTAPLGVSGKGTFSIDLRKDGPHALVAGMTGTGKSELVQTYIASLAASHPPSRLTFVLVDYKGGAGFAQLTELPHVVGFFTDLNPGLAARALVSLKAEMTHREHVLAQHSCKDIAAYEAALEAGGAVEPLPNLLIVFDEFALLKAEMPDFIAGIVDIAQRGRSLGVHLVLATQRPTSAVVDDNIKGNANLRISLRLQSDTDSMEALGMPDAGRLPETPLGRALVRTGSERPTLLQVAYSGYIAAGGPPPVGVADFEASPLAAALETKGPGGGDSDLHRIIAACRDAWPGERPRKPWLEALEADVPLDRVGVGATLQVPVGLLDEPGRQRQRPWLVDLEKDGHLLVLGTGGTGKTTLLQTMAVQLAAQCRPDEVWVYGIDYAIGGGLRQLVGLPHVGGVFVPEEQELVERFVVFLEQLVAQRAAELVKAGAATAADYRASGGVMPAAVVLLDGYARFASTFDPIDNGAVLLRVNELVNVGRAAGVHMVIAADRRAAVPPGLVSQISARLVLRLADLDDYGWLGLRPEVRTLELPPGRALNTASQELQVVRAPDLAARISDIAAATAPVAHGPAPVRLLPETVAVSDLPVTVGSLRVPLGVDGLTLTPAVVDLQDQSSFLVAGPDRSGRSTTLGVLAAQLVAALPGLPSYLLSPRRSPLLDLELWTDTAKGRDACAERAGALVELLDTKTDESPVLVVVDDLDELLEGTAAMHLETLFKRGRDTGLMLLASSQSTNAFKAYSGLLRELGAAKHGLLLAPDLTMDGEVFKVQLPRRGPASWPAGRGFLVRRGRPSLIQVAH